MGTLILYGLKSIKITRVLRYDISSPTSDCIFSFGHLNTKMGSCTDSLSFNILLFECRKNTLFFIASLYIYSEILRRVVLHRGDVCPPRL